VSFSIEYFYLFLFTQHPGYAKQNFLSTLHLQPLSWLKFEIKAMWTKLDCIEASHGDDIVKTQIQPTTQLN
jgi:hypothetical protein